MPNATPAPISSGERRLLGFWRRLVAAALGWGATVLLTLGAVLLACGIEHRWLFGSGVLLTLAGITYQITTGPRIDRLIVSEREARTRAQARAAVLRSTLEAGARALMAELPVDFTQARVSIYRHDQNHFILLARHSNAPALEARGRSRYPDDAGLIGRAWQLGQGVVIDLPDDRAAWDAQCVSEYGMAAEAVAGIAMQAKSLVGQRFETQSSPRSRVGLLVLESLTKRGVNGGTLDKLNTSDTYAVLEQMLVHIVGCLDELDVGESTGSDS